MKLSKNKKKAFGIIYVSLFSFALAVGATNRDKTQALALDSTVYDLSWSWNDQDYPTPCYDAEYHDNDYDCTIIASPQSATYDKNEATLQVTCVTTSDGASNAPPELVDQTIIFDYDVLSADTDSEPYAFSGNRDGVVENIELSSSIVDITGNTGSQEDEYYFEEGGSLYYHGQDGEDYDVTILEITYYSYMQNPDIVLNVVYGDIQQGIPVVVSGSFDPEPQESGSYSGTLSCYMPVTAEAAELDLSGITLTIIDTPEVSWSYVDGYLSYSTSAYTVSQTVQTQIVQTEADAFTVSYAIYTENAQAPQETIDVYFTNANYDDESGNGYYGMLSGECDVIDDPEYITIYAVVEPDLLDPVLYDDGWNYDENDHILVYWDSEHEDANYAFSYAEFYQYKCEAVIVHSGTITGAIDTVTCHILEAVAVFDNSTQSITFSGYLAPEIDYDTMTWPKTDQYVELYFSANDDVREYYQDGWNYSQSYGEFIYQDPTFQQVYDSLDYTSAEFRIAELAVDNYFDITYSVRPEGQNDPITESFHIYAASYEQGNTGGYDITGKIDMDYEGETYVIPVSFNVADMEIKHVFVEGFQYDGQSPILRYYYQEEVEYTATMTQVIWNYFGEESLLNEVLIDYTVYNAQDEVYIPNERVTIKQAEVSEPGGQSNDGYISGYYKGERVTLATSILSYKNVIADGFNFLDGLDELIYFDAQEEVRFSVAITSITANIGKKTATVNSTRNVEGSQSTVNDPFTLTNVTIIHEQTAQQNGFIEGYFASLDKTIRLETPSLILTNTTEHGWHYTNSQLKYYDALDIEDYISYTFSSATFNVDTEVMEITYEMDYSTPSQGQINNQYKSITITSAVISEIAGTSGASYQVTGVCRDVNTTVTLTVPEYFRNSTGWMYAGNDGLFYNDATYGTIYNEFYEASYYADDSYIAITYTLKYSDATDGSVNNREETIIIKNPEFTEIDSATALTYEVTGYCVDVEQDVKVEIPSFDTYRTGWEYTSDGLFYTDANYGGIDNRFNSADYYVDNKKVTIFYTLLYSEATEGEKDDIIATVNISNAVIEELSDTGVTTYKVSGYCEEVSSQVELELESLNYCKTGWVYENDADAIINLYWVDYSASTPVYSDLIEANYNEEYQTVNFVYGIYTEPGSDEPTTGDQEPKPTLVTTKVIHMEEVTSVTRVTPEDNSIFDETMIFVRGTNADVVEASILSVPESKFNTIKYDPEAGTITEDQKTDIRELLPEEKSVDEQRVEDSVSAISSETAHQIITTVNNTLSEIEAQKEAGQITHEEYQEKIEIIETVTEASVVVGAGQISAKEEGKAVDSSLPEDHGLEESISDTLKDFYQRQMNILLNRKADQEGRSIVRLGEPVGQQGSIDLTISKEDYAKMIDFVDTAVSNMKDSALKIRKCSAAKMKKVVGDYIQVVKVSSFREFDAVTAENDFVDAVYKAIMLNMQQQVIDSLKRSHKPTNNPEKELLYQQQLEACEDYDTFEQLVLEVLRQKYNAISNAAELSAEQFEGTYKAIFRSWALDKPEINPTPITLEELTTATIETTKANASRFEYHASIESKETLVFIIFGAVAVLGIGSAIAIPLVVNKTKQKRA